MAVLPPWRMHGGGKALPQNLIETTRKLGGTKVAVHAQVPVLGYYEKFGFTRYGETFTEAGIPHQAMRLDLQPAVAAARRLAKPRVASVKAVKFDSLQD
jgi:predicted GNAT family N-acyltransferase